MGWIFRRPFDFGARSRRWRTATLPIVLEFIASGGIAFGGSASVAVTLNHVASGGIAFGGSASVAVTLNHVASGGMTFGGSADVAFVHAEPTQGGMYFGGAANVAFTKAVVGSGGIVFGGRAYIGDVIGSKFWLNGPGFELGDLLRAQQIDYDKDHNPIGVYSIDAEVVDIRSGQKMVLQIASGKEFLTNALKGQIEFVRLGNRLDSARQGSVMIQSQPACVAVMDTVSDFSKWGTLPTYKGVFGKLSWINDPDFGQLSGWGAFIPNLYAKGNIILGPYSSIQWANVAGSSKPADNATVGADWGANVTGRPTNLVALGDVPGYITSTYIGSTEIKAPNITGNSILGGNIVASSGGTNTAGLTGEGSGDSAVRIWAGSTYANRASAPFRVTQEGAVTASALTVFNPSTGNEQICSKHIQGYGDVIVGAQGTLGELTFYTSYIGGSGGRIHLRTTSAAYIENWIEVPANNGTLALTSQLSAWGNAIDATGPTKKRTFTDKNGLTINVATYD